MRKMITAFALGAFALGAFACAPVFAETDKNARASVPADAPSGTQLVTTDSVGDSVSLDLVNIEAGRGSGIVCGIAPALIRGDATKAIDQIDCWDVCSVGGPPSSDCLAACYAGHPDPEGSGVGGDSWGHGGGGHGGGGTGGCVTTRTCSRPSPCSGGFGPGCGRYTVTAQVACDDPCLDAGSSDFFECLGSACCCPGWVN